MTRAAVLRTAPAVVAAALLAQGCAALRGDPHRPSELPRFIQVDEGLYRGGQPTPAGMERLAGMGVKTVVSLRQPSAVMMRERQRATALGMAWVNFPMWCWRRPSDRQVRAFLEIATDPARRPVFVHCRQGWNRTGVMVAVYRVAIDGWEPSRAYQEARRFGLVPWNLSSRRLILYEARRTFAASTGHP